MPTHGGTRKSLSLKKEINEINETMRQGGGNETADPEPNETSETTRQKHQIMTTPATPTTATELPAEIIAASFARLTGHDQPNADEAVYAEIRELVGWAIQRGLMTRPTGKPGNRPAQPMKATVEPVEASIPSSE
jgi:hypothetical protein